MPWLGSNAIPGRMEFPKTHSLLLAIGLSFDDPLRHSAPSLSRSEMNIQLPLQRRFARSAPAVMSYAIAFFAALLWLAPLPSACGQDSPNLEPLKRWIAFQSSIDTLETKFVQDRKLKTMRHPLRDEGTFWLDHPSLFRWQIDGDPPKMIAIRDKETITLLRPKKKTAQQVVAGSGASPALDFLAKGFPRTLDALLEKFNIIEVKQSSESWEAILVPKDNEAAKSLSRIVFYIEPEKYYLQGFELDLRDGSNIRTYFTRQVYNDGVDASLFEVDLEGYTVEKK